MIQLRRIKVGHQIKISTRLDVLREKGKKKKTPENRCNASTLGKFSLGRISDP